jgi:hypothetical protein
MAEIIVEFDGLITGIDQRAYSARTWGREREDGSWEGWLEFVPVDGTKGAHTERETTQPSRESLAYWASGLTATYLDGALLRVLQPAPDVRVRESTTSPTIGEAPSPAPRAVLDPFAVYAEGEHILRQQLNALSEGQLRSIAAAYDMPGASADGLGAMSKPTLIGLIMMTVRRRAA